MMSEAVCLEYAERQPRHSFPALTDPRIRLTSAWSYFSE